MKAKLIITKDCGNTKAYALYYRLKALGYQAHLTLTSINKRVTQMYLPNIEKDKVDSIKSFYTFINQEQIKVIEL